MTGNTRWGFSFILIIAMAWIGLAACASSAAAATISGSVTDGEKTPVPDATVTLYQNNQVYVTTYNPTLTSVNGYYEFPGLPSGQYSVMAEKDGYTYSGTINLENDATLNLQMLGYTYTPGIPTTTAPVITVLPTPTSAPTPTPSPTPKPKASNTPVPLPPQPAPGFEALLATGAIGLALAAKRYANR